MTQVFIAYLLYALYWDQWDFRLWSKTTQVCFILGILWALIINSDKEKK